LKAQVVPAGFNYQGELFDASGQPLEDGNYDIYFSLFASETDEEPLWGPVLHRLPVYKGVFNTVLEGDDVIAAFEQGAEFLEITVGANAPIHPRQRILSVPYAMRAGKVEGLDFNEHGHALIVGNEDKGMITVSPSTIGDRGSFVVQDGGDIQVVTNRDGGKVLMHMNALSGNVSLGEVTNPYARLDIRKSLGGPHYEGIAIDTDEIKFRRDGIQHFSIRANRVNGSLTFETPNGTENWGDGMDKDGVPQLSISSQGVTVREFTNTSDRRLKENISPIQDGMQRLMQLDPVQYQWKADLNEEDAHQARKQLGLIAQDVEKVLPELVITNDDGLKSVNYIGLIPVLIKSIQDLKKETEELRRALEQKVD
jgi:hypothetical protein